MSQAAECSSATSGPECNGRSGCIWNISQDEQNNTIGSCGCNLQVAYGNDSVCNYCDPNRNNVPGNAACICPSGYGASSDPNEVGTCVPCGEGTYHQINLNETVLEPCTPCSGDHKVVDQNSVHCTCDYANNFVMKENDTCICKTGYQLSTDGTRCTQSSSFSYHGMILMVVVSLVLCCFIVLGISLHRRGESMRKIVDTRTSSI